MTDAPKKPARLAQAPAGPQLPSIGRIVVYMPVRGIGGQAAIITGVSDKADMTVNLSYFPDGRAPEGYVARAEGVPYSAKGEPGSWCWPARVPWNT